MTTTEAPPETNATPAPAAPTPESAYSTDLWDYLHTIEYMPSRKDRDALVAKAQLTGDDRRVHIWNYFFRIKPEDVGRPQQAEIVRLKQARDQMINEHDATTRTLSDRIEQLKLGVDASNQFYADQETRKARKEELEQRIRENGLRLRPHGLYVLAFGGIVSLLLNFGVITAFLTSPFRDGPDTSFGMAFGAWLSGAIFWLIIGGLAYMFFNNQRVGKEQSELNRIKTQERDADLLRQKVIQKHQQEIPGLEAQLANLDVELRTRVQSFRERITALQGSIEALKTQLPTPPSDSQMLAWLSADLERVQRDATESLRLSAIEGVIELTNYDEERQVPNPLVFVGPAELQDPERIPLPYRPLAARQSARLSELTKSFSMEQLRELMPLLRTLGQGGAANRPQSEPQPDRAKHLLARRAAEAEDAYHIFYGVYYIEYIYIGQHTLTMHGFFYDFINDKVTAERTTEQYYHDVVAIERAKEFRSIPLRYDDSEHLLEIEDAPTFTLILPSGDRRTITFANRDYLLGIIRAMPGSAGSEAQRKAFVEAEVEEAKRNAEDAVAAVQDALRLHKLSTGASS